MQSSGKFTFAKDWNLRGGMTYVLVVVQIDKYICYMFDLEYNLAKQIRNVIFDYWTKSRLWAQFTIRSSFARKTQLQAQ